MGLFESSPQPPPQLPPTALSPTDFRAADPTVNLVEWGPPLNRKTCQPHKIAFLRSIFLQDPTRPPCLPTCSRPACQGWSLRSSLWPQHTSGFFRYTPQPPMRPFPPTTCLCISDTSMLFLNEPHMRRVFAWLTVFFGVYSRTRFLSQITLSGLA